ncbi:MAG TPA: hypothetical protein VFH61_12295 [Thermoleophilia bacterium]|nr:hypothetical protein [Thermoleophilia bacterium]
MRACAIYHRPTSTLVEYVVTAGTVLKVCIECRRRLMGAKKRVGGAR